MKQSVAPTKLSYLASYLIIAILVVLPFHALLTTWAGSNFSYYDVFRLVKEALMIPLGVYAAVLVLKHNNLQAELKRSYLTWFIVGYSLIFLVSAIGALVQETVIPKAIGYSLVTNLRFLWFMGVVWVISSVNGTLYKHWVKVVLVPAAVTIGFGVLQKFVLPIDFLRHFGYGPDTIDAVQTVDQKLDFRRVQSSLRGANPFGAYLIIPLTTALEYVRRKKILWLFLGLGLLALFFSYSRSAWIGLIASVATMLWLSLKSQYLRRFLIIGSLVAVVVVGSGIWLLRDNDTVQNAIFHSDETSQSSVSSNDQRLSAIKTGAQDVWDQPFGTGPGSAGPASVHNNQARISENYFIQIGQEIGAVGMALFISITLLVGQALWRRQNHISRVLLVSLVGITVVNLVSHAWTDDTLSLLWWGLAGVALSTPAILKKS